MGICAFDEGNPITLVFDCVSLGTHKIETKDGLSLRRIIGTLSKIIKIPSSKIGDILYYYDILDKKRTIRELGLSSGAILFYL